MEKEMESGTPSIIDLNAELAKLTMFRGRTRSRRWRIEREAAHDWLPTATALFSPPSLQGKVIENPISPALAVGQATAPMSQVRH